MFWRAALKKYKLVGMLAVVAFAPLSYSTDCKSDLTLDKVSFQITANVELASDRK